jgi:hypothetical protein
MNRRPAASVAVLADIHGNLPALSAVLAEADVADAKAGEPGIGGQPGPGGGAGVAGAVVLDQADAQVRRDHLVQHRQEGGERGRVVAGDALGDNLPVPILSSLILPGCF